MSCNCLKTKSIPCCIDILTIGTVATLSASLSVFFKNQTTGRLLILPGASDGAGIVTVDVSDQQFAVNQTYDIWVTASLADLDARKDITVDGEVDDCLLATFEKVYDEDTTVKNVTAFTISLQ